MKGRAAESGDGDREERTTRVAVGADAVVRSALSGTGIELVASCDAASYDARSPEPFRSPTLLPGARGLVVAASAGTGLWRRFRSKMDARPELWDVAHPYDSFVAETLSGADEALRSSGVRFVRFDAAFHAPVRVDFVALAELVGLGGRGPFPLLIHPEHGAWWALRGAWLVDAEVTSGAVRPKPCEGCAAPCVGGRQNAPVARVTPEMRARCVLGQGSRYDPDQIAYHEDWVTTAVRLKTSAGVR